MAEVPDMFAAEPIVAWRAWQLEEAGRARVVLMSVVRPTRWTPGEQVEARCTRDHAPPAAGCGCGIYAARDLAHLRRLGYGGRGSAIGQVALAGEVVEAEQGYRAARAWVLSLFVPYTDWRRAKPLGRTYGVRVGLLNPYPNRGPHGDR